ncbi:hypothetical protein AAG570_003622 [Ranatra chinensis]|uniref:Uncharacterized protein n=1 Tax=Ranatra chinensis TaxID=642074 RepID=A0ABD0YGN7_9HEMI
MASKRRNMFYENKKPETIEIESSPGTKRYLQCPAGFKMAHLKKFLRQKYNLSSTCNFEVLSLPELRRFASHVGSISFGGIVLCKNAPEDASNNATPEASALGTDSFSLN